ncbi:MAG: hypothetical protein U0X39_13620 [Bacteroidales bacterium]
MRKKLTTLAFLVCLTTVIFSQETYTGSRKYIPTGNLETISYRIRTSRGNNIFYNRYTIFGKDEMNQPDTLYIVQLNFLKDRNLIEVKQVDKKSKETTFKVVKFEPLSYLVKPSDAKPIYCVRDYLFNDTTLTVTDDMEAGMFFTIADTTNPVIYLHQVVSIDGNVQFSLDKFRKSMLNPHLAHARDFWDHLAEIRRKKVADSLLLARNIETTMMLTRKIDEEIRKINNDKDSLIKSLDFKRHELLLKDVPANDEALTLFRKRMSNIFLDYYKTDTVDKTVQATYELMSTINHKIEIIKKPVYQYQKNNDFIFVYRYLNMIDTAISHLWLENEKIPLYDTEPFSTLKWLHEKRFEDVRKQMTEFRINYNIEFGDIFSKIQKELNEKYGTRMLDVPTRYSSDFSYSASTVWEKWKHVKKKLRDGKDSIVAPSDDNYIYFFNEYPKAKNGKYKVRLNTAVINGSTIGPTAIEVKRKYKYTTRIGFSAGLINPITVLGEPAYSFKRPYYNFFVTVHHVGFFGGYGSYNNTDSVNVNRKKYLEGGIYLAPGNVFYFKLGLSKFKDYYTDTKLSPFAGISLIFAGFQFEGGYNLTFRSPYAMAGLNIPINR